MELAATSSSRIEIIARPCDDLIKLLIKTITPIKNSETHTKETTGPKAVLSVKGGIPFNPAAPPVIFSVLTIITRIISPKPKVTMAK